jgi:predicted HicB family RNase H-like nuclease
MAAVIIKILSARMEYRGVRGSVEWNEEAGLYRAVVKHQGAVMACQEKEIKELLKTFRICVKDFLRAAQGPSVLADIDKPPDSEVQL